MEMIMTIDFPDGPSGVTMDHGPEPVPAGADRPRQARETPGGGRATRARQPMDGAAPASEPACARRPGADRAREVGSRGGAGSGDACLLTRSSSAPSPFATPRSRISTRSPRSGRDPRSEEHTSELQSRSDLVCRLLLEKKKKINNINL